MSGPKPGPVGPLILGIAAAIGLGGVVAEAAGRDGPSQNARPVAGAVLATAVAVPQRPAWSPRAPLPERRTEVSATTDGRYLYLAGGFGPPEGEERATAPRTLWRYDPAADEWTALTEIPRGVHHAPFQYLDGRLYILGGFRETGFDPVADVHIYDIAADEWRDGAPMPTPRGAAGWAVLEGRIHVIGGTTTGPDAVAGLPDVQITGDNSVNSHEAYDPVTDSWTHLPPMPTPRNHLGAAVASGRIHAVLGRADGVYTLTTHEIYDPLADVWIDAPAVPTGRSGVAVVAHRGSVYAFGGEQLDGRSRTFDATERFDPRTGAWDRLPPMPTARHGLGAAAIDDAIYVVSGGPEPGFAFGDVNERLDPER